MINNESTTSPFEYSFTNNKGKKETKSFDSAEKLCDFYERLRPPPKRKKKRKKPEKDKSSLHRRKSGNIDRGIVN